MNLNNELHFSLSCEEQSSNVEFQDNNITSLYGGLRGRRM